MIRNSFQWSVLGLILAGTLFGMGRQAQAVLLLYDPFDYAAGANLGGVDPDGAGPGVGTAVGQTNTYMGGGTWHARSAGGGYQSLQDAVISSGSLSYAGLATSAGNSVSYGSAVGSAGLYGDSIDIPGTDITTGSVYASFIIRIKSNVNGGTGTTFRHSPAGLVTDVSPPASLGQSLAGQSGTATRMPGGFWMRRDPFVVGETNFSPGKSSGDGIGNGAAGETAGWQTTSAAAQELNQHGDLNGQTAPSIDTPSTWKTYFVVLKYQVNAIPTTDGQEDAVSLWMNPGTGTLGSPTGEADASQDPTGNLGSYYAAINAVGTATQDLDLNPATAIRSFALIGHRQNTENSIAVDFDELRIGTTWADVTPAATGTPGDHNGDGEVDILDYVVWRMTPGQFDGDEGYEDWIENYGAPGGSGAGSADGSAVPEPASASLVILLLAVYGCVARRRTRKA